MFHRRSETLSHRIVVSRTLTKLMLIDFAAAVLVTQVGVAALYVVVDLFERLDIIVRNEVNPGIVGLYFFYKLPFIVYQTVPAATAVALVTTLIQRHRHREILALSAAGVTTQQVAVPFILAAMLLSLASFVWSEMIVPPSVRTAQELNLRDIKKRDRRNILADREIWFRGPTAIYHVSYIDRAAQTLLGVTSYELGEDFSLATIRYFPEIRWTPNGWAIPGGQSRILLAPEETMASPSDELNLQLPNRFEELAEVQREPEELSLADLRRQEHLLKSLGLPATRLSVELYLKTALPFAPLALVLGLIGFNVSLKRSRQLAWSVVGSAAIGFGYWVLLGISSSLGYAGSLPPVVAAWLANCTYMAAGAAFLVKTELPPKSL
ncbi:Lipopolysaccharide export system permease protein LptG [bacterium HR30]|nr:Lipopolysaccharide export system permease protein LptG [bacterium HR30]